MSQTGVDAQDNQANLPSPQAQRKTRPRGAALVALSECALEIGEYTPMQIKQAVVGTGAADKRQVAYMVRTLTQLDHDPHPDHAADALACAICHVNLSRTRALTGGEFYQQRGTGY